MGDHAILMKVAAVATQVPHAQVSTVSTPQPCAARAVTLTTASNILCSNAHSCAPAPHHVLRLGCNTAALLSACPWTGHYQDSNKQDSYEVSTDSRDVKQHILQQLYGQAHLNGLCAFKGKEVKTIAAEKPRKMLLLLRSAPVVILATKGFVMIFRCILCYEIPLPLGSAIAQCLTLLPR